MAHLGIPSLIVHGAHAHAADNLAVHHRRVRTQLGLVLVAVALVAYGEFLPGATAHLLYPALPIGHALAVNRQQGVALFQTGFVCRAAGHHFTDAVDNFKRH